MYTHEIQPEPRMNEHVQHDTEGKEEAVETNGSAGLHVLPNPL